MHLPDLPCWWGEYAAGIVATVLATQGRVCWLCGRDGANSADHDIPRSQGGDDAPTNLRPAHRDCNSRRQDRAPFPPDEDPRPDGVGLSSRWRIAG